MSSPPFAATLELAPRPSLRALTLLFWLHAALLALVLVALPPGKAMALVAGGLGVSWMALRRQAVFGFGPNALTRLTWRADGSWSVHDRRGARWDAALLGSSVVHDRLLLLNFRLQDGGRRSRALLGDELEPEQLRRLRARLLAARDDAPARR